MQYSSGFYGDSLRRLKKNKMAMFCAGILVLLVLVAIFAPVIAPYDPTYQDYSAVLAEPSMAHPFGTDEYGRDILSRIIYGSRVSLSIGIVAQVVASLVGVTLGAVAGYYGGRIDSELSRIMEIFQAFPELIFALAIMTFCRSPSERVCTMREARFSIRTRAIDFSTTCLSSLPNRPQKPV